MKLGCNGDSWQGLSMLTTMPKGFLAMIDPRGWRGRLGGDIAPLAPRRLKPALRRRRAENIGLPMTLGRIGSLEVRLATTAKDVKKAQKLRYQVFYEEMAAVPDALSLFSKRDRDDYDTLCDHLLVIDHDAPPAPFGKPAPRVVGTYRLLRQEIAERHGGFYSASEFAIEPLIAAHPSKRFLELGRSCVLAPYRNKRTVELLWHGIWTYVLHHKIDVMLGCASLEGTDPSRLALPLAFLHHHAAADGEWRVKAVSERYVSMNRIGKEGIDTKRALHALPPLIKGYLRLGASFGDGAVIDHQFGTTDVLVIMPVEKISVRYVGHFGPGAERHAA
jgi:putative hemolysin